MPLFRLPAPENVKTNNIVQFSIYTVQSGDSLSKICAKNELDYNANWKLILALNGIEDANKIYVGQNILLPVLTTNN